MPTRRDKLVRAFRTFDADGSGTLDKTELRAILSRSGTGHTMSDADIDEMMNIFDDDGDGVLSISEYLDLMDGIGDDTKGDDDEDGEDRLSPGATWDERDAAEADDAEADDAEADDAEADDAEADAEGAMPVAAATDTWMEFELGMALDQCKSLAPVGTEIDGPLIRGPDNTFVLTMELANEFVKSKLGAAVLDFEETYSGVINVAKQALADGYLFTAQNAGSVGTVYWMKSCRTIASKVKPAGVTYAIESTCSTPEQLQKAVAFAKSVRAPREDELL